MMTCIKKFKKDILGTTLLEVIIAVAILGIILVPVGNMFSQSMISTILAKERMKVNQLAQSKMESIKATPLGMGLQLGTEVSEHHGDYTVFSKVERINAYDMNTNYSQNPDISETNTPLIDQHDFTIHIDLLASPKTATILYTDHFGIHQSEDISEMVAPINPSLEWDIRYTLGNQIKIDYSKSGAPAGETLELASLVYQYKIKVEGDFSTTDKIAFNVYNPTNHDVSALVIGNDAINNNISVMSKDGKVNSFYNVELRNLTFDYAWLYTVHVRVEKNSKVLIQLEGTKKGE